MQQPPTPTPPAITFTGSVTFTPGCGLCTHAVIAFVRSALANGNVASVTARAGSGHAHEHAAAQLPLAQSGVLPHPEPATEAATGLSAARNQPQPPASDTNGSDPSDVERVLFSHTERQLWATPDGPPDGPPNGFD